MNWQKAVAVLQAVGRYALILVANAWRCLVILGRYALICWEQQKLRRVWRILGSQVFQAREEGEVNPLLTEAVKDTLKKAQDIQATKNAHYQAISALREKMRHAWRAAPGATTTPSEEATTSVEPDNQTFS